jgi:hypothetical protein
MTAVVALANVTLGANASTITFSSISQSYRDLLFVFNMQSTTASDSIAYRVNGLTSLYAFGIFDGNNATVNATTTFNTSFALLDQNYISINTSPYQTATLYMADYSATDRRKNSFIKSNNQRGFQLANNASRSPATAAVTSIVFSLGNWQFAAGSSIALYGVTA